MKANDLNLKMILPTVLVASGLILYLFVNSRKRKYNKSINNEKDGGLTDVNDNQCVCCLRRFFINRGIECEDCKKRCCRKSCSRWSSEDNLWLCLFCHYKRSWTKRNEKPFVTFDTLNCTELETNFKNFTTAKIRGDHQQGDNAACEFNLETDCYKEKNKMENVREIIEKLVEQLVGNVDDTSVDRLYNNPLYDQIFDDYRFRLVNELKHLASTLNSYKPATNSMAHIALRELVERAVDEARKLPGLADSVSEKTPEESSVAEQTYEDLLATAILNKVIEKCQKDQLDGNSNIVHRKRSRRCRYTRSNNEDMEDEDSTDVEIMSHEDCSSECSTKIQHSCNHSDPLSLTIEEQIEEITTVYSSDEDHRCLKADLNFPNSHRVPFPEFGMDIVDPSQESSEESQEMESPGLTDHVTPMESWEENWLFQKKKIAIQSDPISMLVPNPSADYRALIGDKDAEDTSDLSECSVNSDEEVENELYEVIDKVKPKSDTKETFLSSDDHEKPNFAVPSEDLYTEISTSSFNDDENPYATPKVVLNHSDQFIKNEKQEMSSDAQRIKKDTEMIKNELVSNDIEGKEVRDENTVDEVDNVPRIPLPSSKTDAVVGIENVEVTSALSKRLDKEVENELNEVTHQVELKSDTKETSLSFEEDLHPASLNLKVADDKIHSDQLIKNEKQEITSDKDAQMIKNELVSNDFEEKEVRDEDTFAEVDSEIKNVPKLLTSRSESSSSNDESNDKNINELITTKEFLDNERKIREVISMETNSNDDEEKNESSCRKREEANSKVQSEFESKEEIHVDNLELSAPPRPGTIAEREHKKWENAPPIENNPYSKKNIEKRDYERQYSRRLSEVNGNSTASLNSPSPPVIILNSNQTDISRFKRDYYINETGDKLHPEVSSASRPSSSLSSTGSDFERQEIFEPIEVNSESIQNNKLSERERKNSKNEINAKLNNSDINFSGIKSFDDDNHKLIKRIDLRALGFENEFMNNNEKRPSRTPSKLNLKTYGYECGLRRTQSNNHLDSKVNNKFNDKSNLSSNDYQDKRINFEKFNEMKPANSDPNINEKFSYNGNKIPSNSGSDNGSELTNNKLNNSTNNIYYQETSWTNKQFSEEVEEDYKMPSVKKLAEAFDKPTECFTLPRSKVNNKVRSTTPEVQIISKAPQMMHSLTARSISKQFREDLKQISNDTQSLLIEQSKLLESDDKLINDIENPDDLNIIKPGKLKNNIQFWEKLQHQN